MPEISLCEFSMRYEHPAPASLVHVQLYPAQELFVGVLELKPRVAHMLGKSSISKLHP